LRRTLILTVACQIVAGLTASIAVPAAAQVAPRVLNWTGKAQAAAHPANVSADPTPIPGVISRTVAASPRRPAADLPPTLGAPRPGPGLTPASAWLTPHAARVEMASAPVAHTPPPVTMAAAPVPAAVAPPPPRSTAPRADAPMPAAPPPRPAAVAPPVVEAAPPAPHALAPDAPAPGVEADPMAPRRDAPIFRLSPGVQGAPASSVQPTDQPVAQTPAAPSGQAARYYSVHRQAGRQPDGVAMPQPVYLDALPVELTQAPASRDLAEPGGPPTLLRGADGRVQAMTPATDGDLP